MRLNFGGGGGCQKALHAKRNKNQGKRGSNIGESWGSSLQVQLLKRKQLSLAMEPFERLFSVDFTASPPPPARQLSTTTKSITRGCQAILRDEKAESTDRGGGHLHNQGDRHTFEVTNFRHRSGVGKLPRARPGESPGGGGSGAISFITSPWSEPPGVDCHAALGQSAQVLMQDGENKKKWLVVSKKGSFVWDNNWTRKIFLEMRVSSANMHRAPENGRTH